MKPVEGMLLEAREIPGDNLYRLIDRIPTRVRRRLIRRIVIVGAVLIAGCAAHPVSRGFAFKVIGLPSETTRVLLANGDRESLTLSSSVIMTNGPVPAFVPDGYKAIRGPESPEGFDAIGEFDGALYWNRESDNARIIIAWTSQTDAITRFEAKRRSASTDSAFQRIRLADRSKALVQLLEDAAVGSKTTVIQWLKHDHLVTVASTHEDTATVIQVANSVH